MNRYNVFGLSLSLALLAGVSFAQQEPMQQEAAQQEPARQQAATQQAANSPAARSTATARVDISTTISGNQQQPRTLYIMPWQDSIAQIRIPAPGITMAPEPIQPLDRQQFLRFIEAQSLSQPPASTALTKDN